MGRNYHTGRSFLNRMHALPGAHNLSTLSGLLTSIFHLQFLTGLIPDPFKTAARPSVPTINLSESLNKAISRADSTEIPDRDVINGPARLHDCTAPTSD